MKYYRRIDFKSKESADLFYMDILKKVLDNEDWNDEYQKEYIILNNNTDKKTKTFDSITIIVTVQSKTTTFFDCVADAIARYDNKILNVAYTF